MDTQIITIPDIKSLDLLREKYFFRIPKFLLRFLGLWPEDKFISTRVLPVIIMNLVILSLAVVSEFAYSYVHTDNLPLVLDALCPSSTKLVTLIKFLVLLKTRKQVANLISHLRDLWLSGIEKIEYFTR